MVWMQGNLFRAVALTILQTMDIDFFFCRTTTVSQIMTKDPLCVTSDTSATEALNLMVSRGFRHLVCTCYYYINMHYLIDLHILCL